MICHIDLDAFYVQVERVLQRVPLGPTEPCAVVQYSEWKCHMQHEFPSAPVTKWLVVEWSVRWWRARPGLVGRIQLYEFTWITIFPVASCVLCKFGHGWSGEIICQCPTMCVFARPERTLAASHHTCSYLIITIVILPRSLQTNSREAE